MGFMNLSLPTVSVTIGPEWATELNDAIEVIEDHDHSTGKGAKIPAIGLNINADLEFNSNRAIELKSSKFTDQSVSLTGAAHTSSIYSLNGDLYWTNGAGTAVQVTAGSVLPTTPGTVTNLKFDSISSSLSIGPSDDFVCLSVDTSASRTITLPLASAVSIGRLYVIIDASSLSETNPLTISTSGSDTILGAASYVIDSDGASIMLVGDGLSSWKII